MAIKAEQYWGQQTAEALKTLPYAFYPTTQVVDDIHYPEDLIMTDVGSRASIDTEGLFTCHAFALGGTRDNLAALYLSHNYAECSDATVVRAQKALTHLTKAGYSPVFAALIGPSDAVLESRSYGEGHSFERGVAIELTRRLAEHEVTPEIYVYDVAHHTNAIRLQYSPKSKPQFSIAARLLTEKKLVR